MSAILQQHESCPICKETFGDGDGVQIRQKGADSINTASVQRGDTVVVEAGCKVHAECRKRYINKLYIAYQQKKGGSSTTSLKRSARVSTGPFSSKSDCLFCGTLVNLKGSDYSYVKTDTFAKTVLDCCERRSDDWSFAVKGRIEYFGGDLHAADCIYHHKCSVNFRTGYETPGQFQVGLEAKRKRTRRPKDRDQEQAFSEMCSYLEQNDEEQLTVAYLQRKMKENLTSEESLPYGTYYLKNQLRETYGDAIYIAEAEGLNDIVTFREKTCWILRSHYKDSQHGDDEQAQKSSIIRTAARLSKSDIKTNMSSVTDHYPISEELKLDSALEFLPETLRQLLDDMFVGEDKQHKIACIGQAIVQAVRPRAIIAPLQIGLGVQVHHLYRSKFLVQSLSKMGYCSSYDEVIRFEKNAASCVTPDLLVEDINPDSSLLFAGDNVDHNLITIDGKGTFHGMGMIAALTPQRPTSYLVGRRNISELNTAETTKVDIIEYRFSKHALRQMKFQDLPGLQHCDMRVDILWELSFNFKQPVPNWQGMMHLLYKGHTYPGRSSVHYLPMIDMYPGDRTCILSTLEFITNLATTHHVPPVITFDQPLYWKAAEIISSSPENSRLREIVLMLGTFHTLMNLLGAIGTLMDGTGLRNILEVVYGDNAVSHILTGKSVQRAIRGHLLVDMCLHQIVVKSVMDDSTEFTPMIDEVEEMYSSLLDGDITLENFVESTTVIKLSEEIDDKKSKLSARSKTSQLWLNYQQMVRIARAMIKADRTGSWESHLCAVLDALPIFAAAKHFNYLKSAYLYIQEMSKLESTHPDVYKKFHDGYHVIRRTDQFWAGLSCDLVIEQTLMKSVKGSGGLTHGSKMTEEQRAVWTMSAPVMSECNIAMQEFNDLAYVTSEQHKDMTGARIGRDAMDFSKISDKITPCSPFSSDPALRNIVNGVVARDDVNVHEYKSVGMGIISRMVGEPVFSMSFKIKDKAKTMGCSSSVKVAADKCIDTNLLFQRFLVVSKTGDMSLEDVMKYELSPFPPSLFEDHDILRKADKPQYAQALSSYCNTPPSRESISDTIPQTDRYVIDGGSLLHKLKWKSGDTYSNIAKSYADFTSKQYGSATVVFDGYAAGPSIKDNTHLRRGKSNIHPLVNFTEDTLFEGRREEFLSRDRNKQHLISSISAELQSVGCTVIQAVGDADVDIAKAAVDIAREHSTTVIGEDTDLLILLLHYCISDGPVIYFRSDKESKGMPKVYNINSMKGYLGSEMCTRILFLHAFTGCDSTSRIYGIGKKPAFEKLAKGNPDIRSVANAFTTGGKKCTDIDTLGSLAMVVTFGGESTSSLAALRYYMFMTKVATGKSFVTPERLPPTQSATKFHCRRVYYQTMTWMGLESDIDPLEWGWRQVDNKLVPIMSDRKAAPDTLLKMVHCNCSTGCSGLRCSCRKHGLPCTPACGSCQLTYCDNQLLGVAAELDDSDVE